MKKSIVLTVVLLLALTTVASAGPASVTLVSRSGVTAYGPLAGPLVIPPNVPPWTPGDPAWGEAKQAVATYVSPNWPTISGATYISTAYHAEDRTDVTWRWYHDELSLACTAYDIQAGVQVAVSSDDAEWVYVDGVLIGSNGQYNNIVNYPITPQPGTTMLDFVVRNNQGGTSTGNPTGLAYKTTVNYSVPDVIWQPPVVLENFDLLDGATLPLKFKLYQGDTLLTTAQSVTMKVLDATGSVVATWVPGEGTDYLRFDGTEFYYIGNFHTRDYSLTAATYTAVVYDDCTDGALGQISFEVVISEGKGGRK